MSEREGDMPHEHESISHAHGGSLHQHVMAVANPDPWEALKEAIPHKRWHIYISGDWENGWEAELLSSQFAGEGSITVKTNESGWFHDHGDLPSPAAALQALADKLKAATDA